MKRMRLVIAGCLFGLISRVASASSMTARIERTDPDLRRRQPGVCLSGGRRRKSAGLCADAQYMQMRQARTQIAAGPNQNSQGAELKDYCNKQKR
jgi:hypothetical protein